jgi:hypothetical protein
MSINTDTKTKPRRRGRARTQKPCSGYLVVASRVPVALAERVYAAADNEGVTPSRFVADLLADQLPEAVA